MSGVDGAADSTRQPLLGQHASSMIPSSHACVRHHKRKGGDVVTLPPSATINDLVRLLADRRIGAVVIVKPEGLAGIVSERDIVRFVKESGNLSDPVANIMTSDVTTCRPEDDIASLARVMTAKRIRHLPVLEEGRLVAIVSIGDVVKGRLDELETEREHLENYIRS